MALKEGENESLRDFLGRFNREAVRIPNLQQGVTVLDLMSGMKDGDFRSYLGRKSLKTLATVLGKTNDFIKSKEFVRASNMRRCDSEVIKEQKRGGQGKKKAKKEVGYTSIAKCKEKKQKFERYTP